MASHSFNDRTNIPASLKSFITRAHHNNNRFSKIDFIVEVITQKNTNHSNMINVYSATTTEDKHKKNVKAHSIPSIFVQLFFLDQCDDKCALQNDECLIFVCFSNKY